MLQVHTDINTVPDVAKGAVIAIGNFDGVHKGHQELLIGARDMATTLGAPFAVMTFDPHPRAFFHPDAQGFALTSLNMKKERLGLLGVEHLFVLPFDEKLSSLTGIDFINVILKQKLNALFVAVGEGFTFGHKKSGTVALLQDHIPLLEMPSVVCDADDLYSSTRVRTLLQDAQFLSASHVLGWEWVFDAPVIHGQKNGRQLGYPTANQDISYYVQMPFGVYAVDVRIEGEDLWRKGAANFGIRPMFETQHPVFETHIFDFDQDIYGKRLQVKPLKYLRPEAVFDTMDDLMAQMAKDCLKARDTATLQNKPSV